MQDISIKKEQPAWQNDGNMNTSELSLCAMLYNKIVQLYPFLARQIMQPQCLLTHAFILPLQSQVLTVWNHFAVFITSVSAQGKHFLGLQIGWLPHSDLISYIFSGCFFNYFQPTLFLSHLLKNRELVKCFFLVTYMYFLQSTVHHSIHHSDCQMLEQCLKRSKPTLSISEFGGPCHQFL